ncbi:MAG: hypothetical protein RLN69_07230 [Woeseiaceae bacterium]
MRYRIVIALLFWPLLAAAQERPLFASNETLDIVFEFPLNTILRDADERPVVAGTVQYIADDGTAHTLDVTVTTRGKSRLEECRFPPLSVNFKDAEKKDTLFKGQKKIKLVTHCRDGDVYARYLAQEYSIYRAFNVLTDKSFRVRRLNATYRDSEGRKSDITSMAFFLESDNEVADRLGMKTIDVSIVNPSQLEPQHASTLFLFKYLVANTDWSAIQGPGDEGCCHNGKLIAPDGSSEGWLVIPYDFDQSGIINTRYSSPADQLGIRSVRQRLYRGRCINLDLLDETIALFNATRQQTTAELLPAELEGRFRESTSRYIDEFYDIVNDPLKRERSIENPCLGG